MEEVIDFDEWFANYKPPEIKFVAEYDINTGKVLRVGPDHAFKDSKHILPIDRETAEHIIAGTIKISDCVVDIHSNTLEMLEVKSVFKIDDILHRIISKEWTEIEKPDIYITYDSLDRLLTFELTEEYYGTKKLDEKFQPVIPRKVIWDGETILHFLITDYNDPNVLYKMISLKILDLIENKVVIKDIDVPSRFSVYTRRIFKNYVIEYK